MSAFYNEIDPKAAAWLRELIRQGHIADGDVDERSIEDITPNELKKYTQCHFFAGIGVWSHALRNAGWSDDRPIWTGSCPCQPFSSAGQGKGVDDERHLWPAFHWLIKQCRPDIVLGEQVAHKAGAAWFDIVSTDLEAEDYSCGKIVFPACSVGAPHLRQRQYWVAHTTSQGLERPTGESVQRSGAIEGARHAGSSEACELADSNDKGPQGRGERRDSTGERTSGESSLECEERPTGPTNGHWRDADWLFCRDDKWRPVEPSTSPLVDGSPARVGRLRGYGNAIIAPQAQAFIEAVQEINH